LYKVANKNDLMMNDINRILETDNKTEARFIAMQYVGKGDEAVKLFLEKIKKKKNDNATFYNLATIYALQGNENEVIYWLDKCFASGFKPATVSKDLTFEFLFNKPSFTSLLEKYNIYNDFKEKEKLQLQLALDKERYIIVEKEIQFQKKFKQAKILFNSDYQKELSSSPLLLPKGEFETNEEYTNRLIKVIEFKKQLEEVYVEKYDQFVLQKKLKIKNSYTPIRFTINEISSYSQECQCFNIRINDRDEKIKIPIQEAKSFKENLAKVEVTGFKQLQEDAKTWEVFNIQITHPITGSVYAFGSQHNPLYSDYTNENNTETGIPTLDAIASFKEPSGNNLLDGGENGEIIVTINNKGNGRAKDISIKLSSDPVLGLTIENKKDIIGIAAGQSQDISFKITSSREISTINKIPINISFTEARGFIPAPVNITIGTQAFRPPKLEFKEAGIKEVAGNGNYIIENGENIEVSMLIQNTGQGNAENSFATLNINDPNIIAMTPQKMKQSLGTLKAGESRMLTFNFAINNEYKGSDKLPINLMF
jgi:hypothetical protein